MSRSKQIKMNLIGLNVQEEKARLYAEKVVLLHPGLHIKEQTRIALNMDAGEYKQNKQKTELKRIDISLLNEDINLLRQMHKNRTDTNTCHQQLMAAGIITDLREL
ncbi:hypothetical protein [Endozoicomonas sp. Mp262]|uniref:hypothetical protein n=1 Tax=Endozoicomonas sp. Mp262 TaxID=2919499 RepID=UPI0021DB5D63